MASVCLCMIAKDEAKQIERCIRSVEGLAEELLVVDTGSRDGTPELARSLGAEVYEYPWDGSFANARNFAMEKSRSEWLLLLDADEALDAGSIDTVKDFIATTGLDGAHFRIRNYTGVYSPDQYSTHSALRLLRNNGQYRYRGEIHEQIVSDSGENLTSRFAPLDAVVHHYGYLEEIVREKNKRSRNIPILEKQLAEHPEEPFTLFNMGNEYLSMKDYERALGYYKQAMSHLKNRRIAYVPHLFFRIISCHSCLGHSDQALTAAGEAIKEFPACTDYEFLRGSILLARGRYTLAIDSFEACLKMGPPPMQLEFLPGCGTFRPALQMGELYMELEDYERAIRHYNMALSHKSNLYSALYRIGHALGRLDPGGDRAAAGLLSFFTNPKYTPNALLAADILVGEGFLNQAAAALEDLTDTQGRETELDYLRGRILLLRGQSRLGAGRLEAACDAPEPETRILRGVRPKSARLLFAAGLMLEDEALLERALGHIADLCSGATCRAATLMRQIFQGVTPEDPHFAEEGRDEQAVMLDLLEFLLKCRRLELFERLVRGLNYVDGRDLLMNLAKVYDNLGLRSLAAEHVLRSIKELDTVDADGARILLRQLRD